MSTSLYPRHPNRSCNKCLLEGFPNFTPGCYYSVLIREQIWDGYCDMNYAGEQYKISIKLIIIILRFGSNN